MKYLSDLLDAALTNKVAQKVASRYPRAFKVIADRLSLKDFFGFPFTVIIGIFISGIIFFDELSENIENSNWMLSLDQSMAKYFFTVRHENIAQFFYYFTKLCSLPYVMVIALIVVIGSAFLKKYIYIAALLITLLGTGATVQIAKFYFLRIRPEDYSYYNESSYSFPSGHSMAAMAFYGLTFYLIIRNHLNNRRFWAACGVMFILLIGFSRIYLGVHFLSDVLAGYSLGLLWLLLGISIIEWNKQRTKRKQMQTNDNSVV